MSEAMASRYSDYWVAAYRRSIRLARRMLAPVMREPESDGARHAGLRGRERTSFDKETAPAHDESRNATNSAMQDWFDADVDRLQEARATAERGDWTLHSIAAIEAVAKDLRGMSAAYGSALAARLSSSLCHLLETDAAKRKAQSKPTLVRAHIDALRAMARERIHDDTHPVGRVLARTLEDEVARGIRE
ncbi:MAG: hypothetical protein ACREH4_15925 [Vitreimonas sp.]